MVFVAAIFVGLGAGIMMPLMLLRVPKIVAPNARALAMAVVGSSIYFGQFISPFALKAVATISGHDTFRFRFGFLTVGLAIATLVGLVLAIHSYKKHKEQKARVIPPQT
jgi:MFS family permease